MLLPVPGKNSAATISPSYTAIHPAATAWWMALCFRLPVKRYSAGMELDKNKALVNDDQGLLKSGRQPAKYLTYPTYNQLLAQFTPARLTGNSLERNLAKINGSGI